MFTQDPLEVGEPTTGDPERSIHSMVLPELSGLAAFGLGVVSRDTLTMVGSSVLVGAVDGPAVGSVLAGFSKSLIMVRSAMLVGSVGGGGVTAKVVSAASGSVRASKVSFVKSSDLTCMASVLEAEVTSPVCSAARVSAGVAKPAGTRGGVLASIQTSTRSWSLSSTVTSVDFCGI